MKTVDPPAAHLDAELRIDAEDLTNPVHAAISSAVAFAPGAAFPLPAGAPVSLRVPLITVLTLVGLALAGCFSARIGGAVRGTSVRRLLLGSLAAMAVTYGIRSARRHCHLTGCPGSAHPRPEFCHHGPVRRLGYVAAKRVGLETLGWTLVVLGVAALFLPGPGLLMLFAGTVVLSQQYEWFERRVDPVKRLALEGASRGVQTWPRIAASTLGVSWLIGLGIFWGEHPPAPSWWPFSADLWFFGGWGPGASLVVSGLIGLALLVYSVQRFRGRPYDHEAETEQERRRHAVRHRERDERRRSRHGAPSD